MTARTLAAARAGVLVAALTMALGATVRAQSTWSRSYGGPLQDRFYRILATPDSGYGILCSFANGSGNWDGRIVRVGPTGEDLGSGGRIGGQGDDYLYRVTVTSDGGHLFAGITKSYGAGGDDIWLVMLDADGNLAWQKAYGQSGDERLEAIAATPDGGAVVVADAVLPGHGYDCWAFKVNASGAVVWSETIGSTAFDSPAGLLKLPGTGGYAMVGTTYGAGPAQGWIVAFLENGEVSHQNAIGTTGGFLHGRDLVEASDGNFLFLADDDEPAGGYQIMVAKITPEGTILWQEAIGGTGTDGAYRAVPDSEGGCYVVGYTDSFPGSGNVSQGWAARLDSGGGILWQNRYGWSDEDHLEDALPTEDGGLLLVGTAAFNGPDQGQGWVTKVKASDGSLDSSCDFVNATSFTSEATSATLGDLSMTPAQYTPQVVDTTAFATPEAIGSALLCTSPLTCTLDGSASAPEHGSAGFPVSFQATATASDCAELPTFAWTFGDGGTGEGYNPTHTYATSGVFDWSVVIAVEGQSATRDGTIEIGCGYTLSSAGKSFQNKAGFTKVTVTATGQSSCGAPAVSASESWVTPRVLSFRGNKGTVKISVAANPSATPRSAQALVGNAVFAVTQSGAPCKVTAVSPTKTTVAAAGGVEQIAVTATAGACPWTASPNGAAAGWITMLVGSGTGPGTAVYSVAPNSTGRKRTGTVSVATAIGKKTVTVTQNP